MLGGEWKEIYLEMVHKESSYNTPLNAMLHSAVSEHIYRKEYHSNSLPAPNWLQKIVMHQYIETDFRSFLTRAGNMVAPKNLALFWNQTKIQLGYKTTGKDEP